MSLLDLVDFCTRWQRWLPLSNETRPHVIWEQLLSKHRWIKEKVVKKEAKKSQGSYVVDLSRLDPAPGLVPCKKELRKYSAQRCTTLPEIVFSLGPVLIVDYMDPYLQETQLGNTPHTHLHYEIGAT